MIPYFPIRLVTSRRLSNIVIHYKILVCNLQGQQGNYIGAIRYKLVSIV